MKPLPKLRFAHLPTPVEALPRLSAELGVRLLIKRDDQTGLALGGNKTRKLEYLLAEAQANGARTLITAGAAQSNHCRQTAAAAARYGFECVLVLVGDPQENLPRSGNLLLDELFGARLIWTERAQRDETLKAAFESAWAEGRRPYLIPYGGSSPAGAAAYVFAMQELLEQARSQGAHFSLPDWIVFATSSGGTQAGLAAGKEIFGYAGQVLGISVDEPAQALQARVAALAHETADYLGEKIDLNASQVRVNDSYLGAGYGIPAAAELEALRLFARQEGLLLDPVYTARAAAGLIDLARQKLFAPGASVLFWHTGGSPALFARRYQDLWVGD